MQKYYLNENYTINHNGCTLKMVIYTQEFLNSIKNKKVRSNLENSRAYIESYNNLSQDGLCVVYGDAKIYNQARVFGNAQVYDNTEVYEDAQIYGYSKIYDNAKIYGKTFIFKHAQVHGYAIINGTQINLVYEGIEIGDNADIFGCTKIEGYRFINGDTKIYKEMLLPSNEDPRIKSLILKGKTSDKCNTCKYYNQCHFDEIED